MIRKFPPLLTLLFFILLLPFQDVSAQGDLMVMPKRLVFDGSQRSQEINLANTGKDTAIYAISFINYKMTETGSFEQIENPEEGQRFATEFLRYFPRRVTLAPNEAQTIRVQLARTGNLVEGEYRSHMYFRAEEKQQALGEEDVHSAESISIQIKTVFGISIPVIIRYGATNASITISNMDLNFSDEKPRLTMVLKRNGNMSVYGTLHVEHISLQEKVTEIGLVKGISVYTPNSQRRFSMELNSKNLSLNEGRIRVTYKADDEEILGVSELNLTR